MIGRLHSLRGDDTIRRIIRNGGWLLSGSAIAILCNAAQGILIARALGLTAFGVLGVVVTFVTIASRLTSCRVNEFVVQYLNRGDSAHSGHRAAVVKLSFCVETAAALVAFALIWIAAPVGAHWVARSGDASALIRAFAAIVLVNAASETAQGVLQVYGRYRTCSVAGSTGSVVALVGVGIALWHGLGMSGVIAARLGGELVTATILTTTTWAELHRRLGPRWWTARLGALAGERSSIMRFIVSTNASLTLSMLSKDGDILWVGLFRGPAEAGLFRLAHSVASLAFVPVGLLAPSIHPDAAGTAARLRWGEFRALLRRSTIVAAAYVLPAVSLIALLHGPLIRVLYGEQFEPAGLALVALTVGMGLGNIVVWGRVGLLAVGRADFLVKVHLVVIPLKLLAVVTLVPRFGFVAAAAIVAAVYAGAGAVCAWKIRDVARDRRGLHAAPISELATYPES
jgi:O-antigen/teichoic acid export membrane protein